MQTFFDSTPTAENPAGRIAILCYGVFSYLVFFATFVYAIGFIGGFGVPTTLDGTPALSWPLALLVNVGLLGLFALQHSIMAREAFKRWWTQFVPAAAERSTYVLFSSLALIAVFICWQPLGGSVWQVDNNLGRTLLYLGYASGWAIVLWATFLINHFDLFGLRQVWLSFTNQPYRELRFVTPWMYRIVRHPLYLGWLLVFWCTPDMTVAHLLFAVLTTAYTFIGMHLEERDLRKAHPDYADYMRRVPMIIPRLRKAKR